MTGAPILTAAQMRAAEQRLFDGGMPEYALMERAGAAVADIIWRAGGKRDALVLCGPGNNGGDGYVIARLLRERGVPVRVAAMGESRTPSGIRARAAWGGPVDALADAAPATQVVDALFGTGLTRGVDAATAERLGLLMAQAAHSYAVDLPSGVDSDSGALLSSVPWFDVTIAIGALKPAHLLHPAASHGGRLIPVDIGITASDRVHRLAAPTIAAPDRDSHKYRRGLVAVVEGAMPGAAMLAAAAAARSGAGYVKLVGSGRHGRIPLSIVQTPDAGALADKRVATILVGPGLGRDPAAWDSLVAGMTADAPVVADADALWLLAEKGFGDFPRPAILTPHEGEFVRLFGEGQDSKIDRTLSAAARSGAVVIYKGPDTVIAAPDGHCAVASPRRAGCRPPGRGMFWPACAPLGWR